MGQFTVERTHWTELPVGRVYHGAIYRRTNSLDRTSRGPRLSWANLPLNELTGPNFPWAKLPVGRTYFGPNSQWDERTGPLLPWDELTVGQTHQTEVSVGRNQRG